MGKSKKSKSQVRERIKKFSENRRIEKIEADKEKGRERKKIRKVRSQSEIRIKKNRKHSK